MDLNSMLAAAWAWTTTHKALVATFLAGLAAMLTSLSGDIDAKNAQVFVTIAAMLAALSKGIAPVTP